MWHRHITTLEIFSLLFHRSLICTIARQNEMKSEREKKKGMKERKKKFFKKKKYQEEKERTPCYFQQSSSRTSLNQIMYSKEPTKNL